MFLYHILKVYMLLLQYLKFTLWLHAAPLVFKGTGVLNSLKFLGIGVGYDMTPDGVFRYPKWGE